MIKLEDNFLKIARPITTYLPLSSRGGGTSFEPGKQHETEAAVLSSCELSSTIVLRDNLRGDLWENSAYTTKSYFVKRPPVDEEIGFQFQPETEAAINAVVAGIRIPDDIDSETKRKFENAVIDAKLLYERVYRIRDDLQSITGKARKQRFTKREHRMAEMCVPTIGTEYRRIYPMDRALSCNMERNGWVQFYVAENSAQYMLASGFGSGSGGREHQGLFAHTFAALANKGKQIPTVVYHLSDDNQWTKLAEYPTFKALALDLTGNYQADYKNVKTHFAGMLVTPVLKDWKYVNVKETQDE